MVVIVESEIRELEAKFRGRPAVRWSIATQLRRGQLNYNFSVCTPPPEGPNLKGWLPHLKFYPRLAFSIQTHTCTIKCTHIST